MKIKILSTLLFCLIAHITLAESRKDTIYIYGPGGPFGPINECAIEFGKTNAIPIKVIAGPDRIWIEQAKENATIIYGGAEYMLTNFIEGYPGIIDESSRTSLYQRSFAILVRPNNPKNIHSIKDLTKNNIKLLDVNGAGQVGAWEDISGKQGLISSIRKNIGVSYKNTALAIEGWRSDPSFDAWITFSSWHYRLKDITDLIVISASENVSRGTPIALTDKGKHSKYAAQLIEFMKSSRGHAIFKKWGWD